MHIIIPSYEPDDKLLGVVADIKHHLDAKIIVVNDGSGPAYDHFFQACQDSGALLLTHPVNRGKGAALKTAFAYLLENAGEGDTIVTVDSDGQHLVEDIVRVANRTRVEQGRLVLGSRAFVGQVPFRSRFGNKVTAKLFQFVTGQGVTDTQTGLRGFTGEMLPWLLSLDGDRFEYEFNMLLEAKRAGYQLVEEPIETVYLEENKSSHFRPIQDSLRIYAPFVKFMLSASAAALLDMSLFFVLMAVTRNLLLSVVVARVLSAGLQYSLNAHLVFKQSSRRFRFMVRYALLVVGILACNYLLLNSLVGLGIGLVFAKLLTETVLFLVSYRMQNNVVFA